MLSGSLMVASNAPGSPHVVTLSGTGIDMSFVLSRPVRPARNGTSPLQVGSLRFVPQPTQPGSDSTRDVGFRIFPSSQYFNAAVLLRRYEFVCDCGPADPPVDVDDAGSAIRNKEAPKKQAPD